MAESIKEPTIQMGPVTPKAGKRKWLLSPPSDEKSEDVAASFLAQLDPSIADEPVTQQEERRLLWKIDLVLIPIISATLILGAVDKVIISNAAIYGVGNDYSWVGSIFYFGYLLFEFPAAYLVQRLPVAKFLVFTVFGWAVLMLCTATTQSFAALAACRFLMGMMEVPVFPISAIVTAMWWKRSEQPIRIAFWFNQGSSIFAGIVSYGIGHTHTSIHPWRLLFLVLGSFTLLWSIALFFLFPDSPMSCRYLSEREKYVCIQRVKSNNTGVEDKRVKWYQVRECLLDPKTWLLALFALAQNIPNGGLVTFSSIIVTGLGYSALATTLLGIPTGVIATAWQLLWSFIVAKFPNGRCVTIAIMDIFTLISAVLMWKLPRDNKQGLLAAYYSFYSYWGPYVLATSIPMANSSGHSKKLTINAVFFLSYCIGNLIGPQVFQSSDAPDYSHGYRGLVACIVVAMAAIVGYGHLCHRENKRRDALGAVVDSESEAFSDLTDREKASFRYVF
ncbi:MFS general substrate transporter [Lecanosticta acicola]|uniref:MFS general substrate transporter n=1 Tax=Lecanosticta acicola TaxID=111012 RepID=A0AAI8YWC9_9PEZI|nr:MFS general substrate transporter [Lecanosticta acicola]